MREGLNLFIAALIVAALIHFAAASASADAARPSPPNIVVIVADDIGHGDLGCFGQKMLKTPALDAMAADGMRFTQFYAGGATGAESRRVLLTGRHPGRQPGPENADKPAPILPGQPTLVTVLKGAGYDIATIGEWGADVEGHLRSVDDVLLFIRSPRRSPFLLMLSPTAPAGDPGEFAGGDWPDSEKRFAGKVRDLDRDVGRIISLLKELGIEKSTLVLFTSSTGPNADSGRDVDFFTSCGKYRVGPGGLLEGSIRVPMIAWWPGLIAPGGENDRQWYAGDILATAAELAGVKLPDHGDKPKPDPATLLDSDSLVPALRGQVNKDLWARRGRLYWESSKGPTSQALRFGKWKAIRSPMFTGPVELFDMSNDPSEKRDYAQRRPDLAKHATNLLNASRPAVPNSPASRPN